VDDHRRDEDEPVTGELHAPAELGVLQVAHPRVETTRVKED
jgi:hypothetical protein